MRFLVALFALLVTVAYAHHSTEHRLKYPEFILKKTHQYDVTINMTAGVPGLHPQVSKSVIQMELEIYAKSKTDLVIMAQRVLVSHSLPGVGSDTDRVSLKKDSALEEKLKKPITAVYKNGVITKYTLDPNESVESAKIKRTILRNLEVYLDPKAVTGRHEVWSPITYNRTTVTPLGNYSSHYIVNSSPYAAFPLEKNVYNISRSDNMDVIPYLAYKSHHNFHQQGCPEVCNKDHIENPYDAGCPSQLEPYKTPIKKSFYQKHNIRTVKTGETIHDIVETVETHTADLYDQNMEIIIKSLITFKRTTSKSIKDPINQKIYTDLNNWSKEINEQEISDLCGYPDPREAVNSVKKILEEISSIVIEGKIENPKSRLIGEQVILLQKALTVLKEGDLRTIQQSIVNFDDLSGASELDKVKRQIWMDSIPLIGSDDSVSFIVQLITENMNKPNKAISLWESKSILEALPENILEPSEKTITSLSSLIDAVTDSSTPGYTLFYSASHLAVSRVIQVLCSVSSGVPDVEEGSGWKNSRGRLSESIYRRVCPKTIVKKFVSDVATKLKSTTENSKRVIYIQTLARTGLLEALKVLKPYINGHIEGLTHSYIDYIRTVTIHSLHHIATRHPRPVQDIVVPIFFNKTEPPKIRTSSFGVIVKSIPTLGLFQHIAEETWREPSEEVASYVTTTLETFGNSSIPCHQLISRRIKKILPQIKRSVGGRQKAQNILWTLFDSVRGFGLESRFEFTPSNESFIPAVIYSALGANVDSFRDIFFQFAVTSQGLTSKNVWDSVLKTLRIPTAEDIPKSKESEIFPDLEVLSRDPEFWRVTIYEKLFYSSSYYYYDAEEASKHEFYKILRDQISHYITVDKHGNLDGHIVKLYIPSSYQTRAISHTLPSPVEFEMRNPLVISFKLKSETTKSSTSGTAVTFDIKPSVYYTTLYTNQFLNLGDCKDIGVYHEKRVSASYPVKISVTVGKDNKVGFSYTFPELPKTVFTYTSEAGTYAGKKKLVALPPMEDRRTYKTIPSQFERTDTFGAVGFPPFVSRVLTEDIQFGYEDIPRDSKEAWSQIVRDFLNAGWRRKSIVLKRIPSTPIWGAGTEVKVDLYFGRRHVIPKSKSSKDWTKDFKFNDSLTEESTAAYGAEGERLTKTIIEMPHIKDKVSVKVEQTTLGKSIVTGYLDIGYKHTYGGMLHIVHINASAKIPQVEKNISMSVSYGIAFTGRPDEFNYNSDSYGRQRGLAIGTISYPTFSPFVNPTVSAKAVFYYEPLERILKKEMSPAPTREQFWPETHYECVKDVKSGKSQSVACIKAVREWSIYNKLRVHAVWNKKLPSLVVRAGHQFDLALKHAFYTHLTSHKRISGKYIHFDGTFINKMTDRPVIDFTITKPTEIVTFRRIHADRIRPVSSIDSIYDTYVQEYTNNTYPATCALMENYIRTYDLKTFKLPREDIPSCTYVLSTHCTDNKKFAVLVTIDPDVPGTKEIHIYLGKEEYVLTPGKSSSEYSIKHDRHTSTIRPHHPLMFDEKAVVYASVHVTTGSASPVVFTAEKAGIKITYNGKSLKIQVHPRYKGEVCGLCSEFNGEVTRELRGIDQCLYSHSTDFFKSAMVGTCGDRDSIYPKICSDDEVTFAQGKPARSGREPTMKRNVILQRDDKFCFSTRPIPACEGEVAINSETQNIDFHCLPKSDHNARRLFVEAKRRVLGELETKTVHRTEPVEVPTEC